MSTSAKYYVQPRGQPAVLPLKSASQKSQLKSYFIVIGLGAGGLIGAFGAAMAYLAYFHNADRASLADSIIKTKIVSLVFLGVGVGLASLSLIVCTCFGFNPSSE